ncbi:response regulator transcription factor [Marinoscillum sp. MHG1-6]|uniref:response regulator transcription factor n=1 Tax=Marinoscillum sp. MHG1-6 TaxID=2959627 RepID=UPI0021581C5E|nr:response regulator [Marinoscillum sp. MHG1-6]
MKQTVLVIDDSAYTRMTLIKAIEGAGYQVIGEAKNGEEALDKIITLRPEVITLDNILPDMTGLQILKTLKNEGIRVGVIMISAVGQQSAIEEAMSLGANAYLIKPYSKEKLLNELKLVFKNA